VGAAAFKRFQTQPPSAVSATTLAELKLSV